MNESNSPKRPVSRSQSNHYKSNSRSQSSSGKKAGWSLGKILGTIFLIGLTTGIICLISILAMVGIFMDPSMDVTLDSLNLRQSSIMYYQNHATGEWVQQEKLHAGSDRQWVSLDQIPKHMQEAAIAIEDKRFRSHQGVDWFRTMSAVKNLFTGGSQFGGSTITQQLVKNLTQDDDVSMKRKLQEIYRAVELDRKYSKDQILEYYLNTIYLGQNCNGVQAAAKTYFGKDVSELSLAESAAIVGITKYPGRYDPFVHPDYNKQRKETILAAMYDQGKITEKEKAAADAETLLFQKDEMQQQSKEKQSYYVDQVINDVINDLMKEYGYKYKVAEQLIYSGGLRIYTAMDPTIQSAMDSVFVDNPNFPKTVGSKQPEAAMVIIDPYTGAITGLIGGVGEKTANRTFNRATAATRQPGSAIKPVAVYAPAMEKNLITEASVFDDAPFDIAKRYPKNYDNKYRGLMTVKRAVEISTNPVPVRILNELGVQESFDFMTNNLGFTTLVEREVTQNGKIRTDLGLGSLGLGGLTRGVTVAELTAAYVPFANKGLYYKPFTYYKVEDASGKILLENKAKPREAMSEQTAFIMNDLLQGVVENGTGVAAKISGQPTAGKTGTTSEDYDRWFVGYTPYYVGSVWYGFDTNKTIVTVKGANPALSIWKQVMSKIHEGKERADFYKPEGIVKADYCMDSGLAPTDACRNDPRGSRIASAYFKKGTEPTDRCNVHVSVTICADSNQVAGEYCPDSSHRTVSLLNVKREYPYAITIADAQYTYLPALSGKFGVPGTLSYQSLLSSGMNPGSSGVSNPMNYVCSVHNGSFVPELPWDPNDPTIPSSTKPPEGGTNPGKPGTGGETGGTTEPEDPDELPTGPIVRPGGFGR